ncbi:Palmitoyl-protein_thioesterase [Hexamita inflata]|uniref:palmitoyl-CoA hydrolase n=1 Tax=Hexamita inflata TaxID=28002 RepID=A0AA86U738_9EUKA|nr:Palmitoyl-protein thioesterase [Hexamita inflata]
MTDKSDLDDLSAFLTEMIPDLYVLNCEVGNGYNDSIFMDIYSSVAELTRCIVNDPHLKSGFIALGYSQGGYLMRGYLQTKSPDMPRVLRFISLSAPLAGYFCGVSNPCWNYPVFPDFINNLIGDLEYTDFVQNLLTGASYWNDPYKHSIYLAYKTHLSYLNNEVEINSDFKQNFLEPDLYVLFGSKSDNIIVPWQSAWFGFFVDDDKTVQKMEEREVYILDAFGLKTVNEEGRVVRIDSGLGHFKYVHNEEFIKEELAPWVQMNV